MNLRFRLLVVGAAVAVSAGVSRPVLADDARISKLNEIAATQQEIVESLEQSFKSRKAWNESYGPIILDFAKSSTLLMETDLKNMDAQTAIQVREAVQQAAGLARQGRLYLPSLLKSLDGLKKSKYSQLQKLATTLEEGLKKDSTLMAAKDAQGMKKLELGQGLRSNIDHTKDIAGMKAVKASAELAADTMKEVPLCSEVQKEFSLLQSMRGKTYDDFKAVKDRIETEAAYDKMERQKMLDGFDASRREGLRSAEGRLDKSKFEERNRAAGELKPLQAKAKALSDKKAELSAKLEENAKAVKTLVSHFHVVPTVDSIFSGIPFKSGVEEKAVELAAVEEALVSSIRQDTNNALAASNLENADLDKVFSNISSLKEVPGLSQVHVQPSEGFNKKDLANLQKLHFEYKKMSAEFALTKIAADEQQKLVDIVNGKSAERVAGLEKQKGLEQGFTTKLSDTITGRIGQYYEARATKRAERLAAAQKKAETDRGHYDFRLKSLADGNVAAKCKELEESLPHLDKYGTSAKELKDIAIKGNLIKMWSGDRSNFEIHGGPKKK
jgi:hypothetical protein